MLTVMYFRMTEKGYVSMPRTELADILGVDTRQITRWIREAIDARLLDKVGGGYRGRTAEYAAVIPCLKVGCHAPPLGAKTTHLSPGQTRQEGGLKQPTQYARVTNVTIKNAPRKERRVLLSELSPWARLAYAPLPAVSA
jgi:hypothetical protein